MKAPSGPISSAATFPTSSGVADNAFLEAEFGGDHHLGTERLKRLAEQLLIGERSIGFGRVEEGDAALEGGADEPDGRLLFGCRAVAVAQPHAAETEGGDFQSAFAECALFHCFLLLMFSESPGRRGIRRP